MAKKLNYLVIFILMAAIIHILFQVTATYGNFEPSVTCNESQMIESMKFRSYDDSFVKNVYLDVSVSEVDFNMNQDMLVVLNIPETSASIWQFHLWKD